jgi:manganese transport protein
MLSIAGDDATALLLVATQVVLSLQLPFALVPLIRFTASRDVMGAHANARAINTAAWIAATLIVACNAWLVVQTLGEHASKILAVALAVGGVAGLGLLVYLAVAPLRRTHDGAPEVAGNAVS